MPDVESMLQLGDLTPDTLGWHPGCKEWLPLRELPALADAELDMPPTDAADQPEPIAVELGEKLPPNLPPLLFDVVLPSPFSRFLARMVDMSLYATTLLGILYAAHVPFSGAFQPFILTFWLPLILLEACILTQCGTSPGKWLLGIKLQFTKERRSFPAALLRSVMAFIMGLGCMYPPLFFLMLTISFFSVRRRGVSLWDVNTAIVPMIVSAPSIGRKVGACLIIFTCLQLSSHFMQPWLPDIMDSIRERDPQAAHTLENLINRVQP